MGSLAPHPGKGANLTKSEILISEKTVGSKNEIAPRERDRIVKMELQICDRVAVHIGIDVRVRGKPFITQLTGNALKRSGSDEGKRLAA